MNNSVCIVMGTYNGERYLQEQLKSFEDQSHKSWSLIASDDGSSDQTLAILNAFKTKHRERDIRVVDGPRKGFAANFLKTLSKVGADADIVCFSDQDDIWHPDKLKHSLKRLSYYPKSKPAMTCGRTKIFIQEINDGWTSPHIKRPPSFENALVQNIGGANTMHLNRKAFEIVHHHTKNFNEFVAHDWTCYQILTGVGAKVIFEEKPLVYYRQHTNNLIGSNSGFLDKIRRVKRLLNGEYLSWFDTNAKVLGELKPKLTPQNRKIFECFEQSRSGNFKERLEAASKSGIHRQSNLTTLATQVSIVAKLM